MQPYHTITGRLAHIPGERDDGGDVHTVGGHAGQFFVSRNLALSYRFLWRHVMPFHSQVWSANTTIPRRVD